jgi:hypothetical protein
MTATWSGKRIILAQHGGGGGPWENYGGWGIYVTDDGLVFSYVYEPPDEYFENATPCDVRQVRAGSPEQYECLHYDSKLRAKLEPTLLGALELDLARVTASERVEVQQIVYDGGSVVLDVPGRGYKGSALEIAACNNGGDVAWQRSSPEASWIFTVVRRLRRALGGAWSLVAACPEPLTADGRWDPVKRKEIVPGVLAWWSNEE